MYRIDVCVCVVRIIVSGMSSELRSLTDGRARPDIFAAGHVRIVPFRDLCDHPSSAVRVKTWRMFYARFALMHELCHVVQFCFVPCAVGFRQEFSVDTDVDDVSGCHADLRIDSLRGKTPILFTRERINLSPDKLITEKLKIDIVKLSFN